MTSPNSNYHPDFSLPWCLTLLSSPGITNITIPPRDPSSPPSPEVSNSMFLRTLYTPHAIRAQINFQRPRPSTSPAPLATSVEYCNLLSVGDGVDGKKGRAHGGFNSLILDQMLGMTAALTSKATAPATATMTVDYKAEISTPGVVLCRGWAESVEGRKIWVKGVVEDGEGRVLAVGRALFVAAREDKI